MKNDKNDKTLRHKVALGEYIHLIFHKSEPDGSLSWPYMFCPWAIFFGNEIRLWLYNSDLIVDILRPNSVEFWSPTSYKMVSFCKTKVSGPSI